MSDNCPTAQNAAPQNAIEVRGLRKVYGGKPPFQALKSIDLDIPRGSFFGLLGPNGAGKSTFINILAGLVNKTSGTAKVWGYDIDKQSRNASASIGVVPQEILFDAFFTPREALELQAGMYGVPQAERVTEEILAAVHLLDKADAYARTLSGGMKRRLLVAKAMVHQPPILVLDEPTAGVDIALRQQLWDYIRELNEAGVTIVLTTHYLEEAESLCDRIAIINEGEVVVNEPTETLVQRIDEKELDFVVDKPVPVIPEALKQFRVELTGERRFSVHYSPELDQIDRVLTAVRESGLQIIDLSTKEADLEDIFVQITSSPGLDEASLSEA